MKIPKSILFIVALTSFAACSSPKTVRAMADKKKLTLGVAIQAGDIYDPASVTLLQENFNLLVAENTSKWKLIRPSLKFWNWSDMDKMVEFAETNKMKMKWHTFVWHQQNPPYVDGLKTRDDAIAMLTEHITTIMSRYKGRIWEYDVCNEVLNEDGTMRDTVWLRTIGPEYLDIAFKTARETDPKARLLLNDYNNEYAGTAKGDGFYRLVKDLQDRGIPIDGVGFQLHAVAKYGIDETALRKNIQRFNDLGLFVSFTEIDVRVEIPLTEKKEAEQTAAYKKLMEVALSESNAGSFILWGYTDAKSWIPAAFGGYGSAHPFDREVKPKPVWAELQKMLNDAKPRKK